MFKTRECNRCNGSGKILDPLDVGAKMRTFRIGKGLSMTEMARQLSFSVPYIRDLEFGRRAWNQQLIEKYTKACK